MPEPVPPPVPAPGPSRSVQRAHGTLPLGPDEPELFTDAMRRIITHLEQDDHRRRQAQPRTPATRPAPAQTTWTDRLASPNQ